MKSTSLFAALLALSLCNHAFCAELIAHYEFEDNCVDVSGNGNNGTVNNVQFLSSGLSGGDHCAYFTGDNSWISIGNNVKPNYPFTVSFWAKGGKGVLFSNDRVDSNYYRHGFSLGFNSGIPAIEFLSGYASANTRYQVVPAGLTQISDSIWRHVAVVSYSHDDTRWFIDGQAYASKHVGDGAGGNMTYSSSGIGHIGRNYPDNSLYKGFLDELRIYSGALSETDIKQLYSSYSIVSYFPNFNGWLYLNFPYAYSWSEQRWIFFWGNPWVRDLETNQDIKMRILVPEDIVEKEIKFVLDVDTIPHISFSESGFNYSLPDSDPETTGQGSFFYRKIDPIKAFIELTFQSGPLQGTTVNGNMYFNTMMTGNLDPSIGIAFEILKD